MDPGIKSIALFRGPVPIHAVYEECAHLCHYALLEKRGLVPYWYRFNDATSWMKDAITRIGDGPEMNRFCRHLNECIAKRSLVDSQATLELMAADVTDLKMSIEVYRGNMMGMLNKAGFSAQEVKDLMIQFDGLIESEATLVRNSCIVGE